MEVIIVNGDQKNQKVNNNEIPPNKKVDIVRKSCRFDEDSETLITTCIPTDEVTYFPLKAPISENMTGNRESIASNKISRLSFQSNGGVVRNNAQSAKEIACVPIGSESSTSKKLSIVLDCANIGWSYGKTFFDLEGVCKAIAYLERYPPDQVNIISFLPMGYFQRKQKSGGINKNEGWYLLNELVTQGKITLVPSGDHDDKYILLYAKMNHGYVVSNDMYSDHSLDVAQMEVDGEYSKEIDNEWLKDYRCGYTFVNGQEFLLNPNSQLCHCLAEIDVNDPSPSFELSTSTFENDRRPSEDVYSKNSFNSKVEYPTSSMNTPNNQTLLYIPDSDLCQFPLSLQSLCASINIHYQFQMWLELKYLLLARAHSWLQINCINYALQDVSFLLFNIDCHCQEALQLYHKLTTTQD